LEANDLFAG
jgi:hypothetical protein